MKVQALPFSGSSRRIFPKSDVVVWALFGGSPIPPPSPVRGVETAVRSECEHPAIMIVVRGISSNGFEDPIGSRIRHIRIGSACQIARDHDIAVGVGVVNIETAVVNWRAKIRVKGHAEQAAFCPDRGVRDESTHVEKRSGPRSAAQRIQNADEPSLFDDKEAIQVVWRCREKQR